ncbi:ATP-binding cassette domain-containing protein [Enterobacteriaceae endosymbiont of Neohaemonia nigricornis]|uniref:ATP-binding cassette domain-containing protein n=1 Tax=Enterobacteriaceae endosymbiont of Neohaemonia nigricornis TaxID=2675792 RepID=UPI00144A20CB|nr:ATP-binding cassette domain-containing protein [Enterobacteriaceae endosymbiont of Neohaemonia nigricornis]QJC30606.1 ATP-binding cassette domain-containing protein [Enterobacteriaceae endosymbiont of Neohaemonia nigricornis]
MIVFYILLFYKYQKKYLKMLLLGIIMSIVANFCSIFLSILSGFFLTSTFLFKHHFAEYNYIIPSIIIRFLSMFKTITKYYEKIIKHNNTLNILKNLRIIIFTKIFPLYPYDIINIYNSEILQLFISDIETIDILYIQIISPIISLCITIFIIIIHLIILNYCLTILFIIFLCMPLTYFAIYFYNKGYLISTNNIKYKKKYYLALYNFLLYQQEYKIFEGITCIKKKLNILEYKWEQQQTKQNYYDTQSNTILSIIIGINLLIILIFSYIILVPKKYSRYFIISYILSTITLNYLILSISHVFQHINNILISTKNIFKIINKKPTINFNKSKISSFNKIISLKIINLSFYYNTNDIHTLVLNNLSLNIKNHDVIAITGHNGCGKSTLLMLLTRAWEPISGNIYINNYNLNTINLSILRKIISVIPQKTEILNDTLKNNLLLNNQKKNISNDFLVKILYLVGLDKLILNKQHLNIQLGENQRLLSGGELKKLALARAIIHNGHIILLDEPTVGLDKKTSKKILQLIFSVFKKKIIIIVTHDIAILKRMKYIYVMDNGSIIEKGSHITLINKKQHYWNYIHTLL